MTILVAVFDLKGEISQSNNPHSEQGHSEIRGLKTEMGGRFRLKNVEGLNSKQTTTHAKTLSLRRPAMRTQILTDGPHQG